MEISNDTMNIFRNFSTIFPAISMNEPKSIKTMSSSENIIGCYDTEETFPPFSIYDLNQFLGMVSLFDLEKTDFEFIKNEEKDQDFVKITSGNNMVKYLFTDRDLIPNIEKIETVEKYRNIGEFTSFIEISKEDFIKINKAAQIMKVSNLNIKIINNNGIITVSDPTNPMSNDYRICVKGEGEGEINIKVDYLLMIPGDYKLSIQPNVFLKMEHKSISSLFYLIASNKL